MSEPVWTFEHAVECVVPRVFVWKYWTNPANWDDPPARFEFDGPFAVGTRLTTVLPGQRLQSVIREILHEREALIEMELTRATVEFRWRFEELAVERTKITQVIRLSGEGGAGLIEQAKVLEQSVPLGMTKLAAAVRRKWLAGRSGPNRGAN